ncbi:MAG: tetratricopeptide repeat protein [Acidobacteriota bacterium]
MRKELRKEMLELCSNGAKAIKTGDFQKALKNYQEAKKIATTLKDQNAIHKCMANLSLVYVELGEYKKAEEGLREVIISSTDDRVIFGASYCLAISLRRQGKYAQALKYAAKALQKSIAMNDLDAEARVHNLLGNIHLFQSYIDEAISEYLKALEIRRASREDNKFSLAILKENIGYSLILKKDYPNGIRYIKEAMNLAKVIGDRRCLSECYQDLCYAYMLLRKLKDAEKTGDNALHLSLDHGYRDIEKNCYYLLGEINFLKGNPEKMEQYFQKLQEFYPHLPFLKEFLKEFDVSEFITLKQ